MRNRVYRFGKFRLTSGTRELARDGERLQLPRRAFDCLLYLIEQRERAVGRDELTAAVWGRVDVTDAQLSQIMLAARRAIDDSGQAQQAIRTLPGFGYHWVMDIEELADAAVDAESPATTDGSPAEIAQVSARPRPFPFAIVVIVTLVAIVVASRFMAHAPDASEHSPAAAKMSALAVFPIDVTGPDESAWVRLGAMDLIAECLRAAGLPVPPSESVLVALRGVGEAAGSTRSGKLAGTLGVGMIVEGTAMKSADGWTIALSANGADARRYTSTATHADVITASRQSADRLLASLGRTPPLSATDADVTGERLQQVQAALLAGQVETARQVLDTIPESARATPRFGLSQAQVETRVGRLDQAEAIYTRLIADPAVRTEPVLYGRALGFRGGVHGRRGEHALAERDFDVAIVALRAADSPIDLARALNGRGVARIAQDHYDDAAVDLGRARIELQRVGDRYGLIQSDVNFGLLEAARNRMEQALPYLLGAAGRFEAFGAPTRMLGALDAAFGAEAALLRWPDAFAVAERQWSQRERAGDPGLRLAIGVNRATALLALGRLQEAQDLLDDIERESGEARPLAMRDLYAARAALAWRRGLAGDAATAAEQAMALWPPDEESGDERRALLGLLRLRASIAAGRADAAVLAREFEPIAGAAPVLPVLAVVHAEWIARQGRHAEAEPVFHAALAQAEARGVPMEIAIVAQSYGYWLLAQGRADEAAGLAGRIAPWAEHDFDCAVFLAAVMRARGDREALGTALQQVRALAGERKIPD